MTIRICCLVVFLTLVAGRIFADGPGDNDPKTVRQVPPVGMEIPEKDLEQFEKGLQSLKTKLEKLKASKSKKVQRLLPDVEIFYRALRGNIDHKEFFKKWDIPAGHRVLKEGLSRADSLLKDQAPWTTETGFVVRGFRSKLDDTVQPYGLEIPVSFTPKANGKTYRCDLWFHGRGETVGETQFIDQRMRRGGKFQPKETIVVHPYGRYSNAFKFAGETDVFEALNDAKKNYPIDEDRTSVRGFSMGGAGCWQMAVHYPDLFFAATPGAGFSETPEFLKVFQDETLKPTWFEKELWKLYDCPGYAVNLSHCPTIAYSGELDKQKQAADVMEKALSHEGIDLLHIIGPKMGHKIDPNSAKNIESRVESLAKKGRNRVPNTIRFTTYTLKYNRMHWLSLDGLEEHWKQARVGARLDDYANQIVVELKNVNAFSIHFDAGLAPFSLFQPIVISINGEELNCGKVKSDSSFECAFHKLDGKWIRGPVDKEALRKRHNLQGPIDDAFMDRFVFVEPTGQSKLPLVDKWAQSELKRAKIHWRQQMRGDVRTIKDTELTEKEIKESNLILWGDPASNEVIKKIVDKLPILWDGDQIHVGEKKFDVKNHAPILVYPNPLNPSKYVVLNSSFTYREYAYLNNARQVPMLPDWAIVDLNTPPGTRFPGKIVEAGFFDEKWELKK